MEKLLPAESSVMSLPAPAASVVVPVTAKFPLSVIAPAVVTFKVPEILEVPRLRELASWSVTLVARLTATVPKSFVAVFNVIAPFPVERFAVPAVIVVPAVWLIAPPVVLPPVLV